MRTRVSISYTGLVDDVTVGSTILIDDGLIGLEVTGKTDREIACRVVNGGELGERKGVNVPNVPVRLPAITDKDREDLKFGVEQGIDFIAASFVRNAECIMEIRAFLKTCNAPYIPIIAKIENAEGIKNIDEIIRCADGIMVARGDLGGGDPGRGGAVPAEDDQPEVQLLLQAGHHGDPDAGFHDRNPRPTRAEVTDVANAGPTTARTQSCSPARRRRASTPLEALRMMVHIVRSTEEHLDYDMLLKKAEEHRMKGISTAIGTPL